MYFTSDSMVDETVPVAERSPLPPGDYVSPGMQIVRPDRCFPNLTVGDTSQCAWPYLRRDVPHNWYVDRRAPAIGFLNRDEAHIVYNTALGFAGRRALEIGCWLGWSACHLALAGVQLDVVDPILERSDVRNSVRQSLNAAGLPGPVNLFAGKSPIAVQELSNANQRRRWSLFFVDGNHDGPFPIYDAAVCAEYAEDDALILIHDLASPDVALGLDYLRNRGWETMVYCTAQIMGVGWRGSVKPVNHVPDPDVQWTIPTHLSGYRISGARAG